MTEKHPTPERQAEYLATWKLVLANLLGWSEEQVIAFAEETRKGFLDNPFLEHETAYYYIVPLLFLQVSKGLSLSEFNQLHSRLELVLVTGGAAGSSADGEYDWPTIRCRINAILAEYGTQLLQ